MLKNGDMLESLVKEFSESFPEFKRVLIDERDMYLTSSLKNAAQPMPNEFVHGGFQPACVVGVVGLGHMKGIKENWNKEFNINEIIG
jgi:pheromone shutdown protein TraB